MMSDVYISFTKTGEAVIKNRIKTRTKVAMAVWLILFMASSIAVMQFYPKATAWFHANYTPVQKEVEAVDEINDSSLEQAAIDWIHKKQRVVVTADQAQSIVREVFTQSLKYKVDPFVVMGLISVESGFNTRAISKAGAIGLTQVIPKWHTDKISNPVHVFDLKVNIQVGIQVFAEYMSRQKGDINLALRQYNGSLGIPNFGYDRKVLSERNDFINHITRNL